MGHWGGSKLRDILEKQRRELEDYYGFINEIKMGVRTQAPRKPDLLAAVEVFQANGLPLVAGGLMDQPHIWILQVEMVDGVKRMFQAIDDMQGNK